MAVADDTNRPAPDSDEARLAELGYRQELHRTWSGFSNFAISFSIISILAGCFTTFAQAWNNGGPIAISIGWPLISVFILIIGLCLAEMGSAYPTAGGIYWWAARLGGPAAGFYTGWLNLVGLIAVTASIVYACAGFWNITLTLFWSGWGDTFGGDALTQQFFWFVVIMALVCVLNIFSSHLLALINNVSAGWHVLGAAVIIVVLLVASDGHQSADFIFTERINNSGFSDSAWSFWFYVLPLGFLLTQYTITGFDASAHLSEETHAASRTVARGIWTSIFYSAIGGWLLLLAFLWAAKDVGFINSPDNGYGVGSVIAIFSSALSPALFKLVMVIATIGQVFCGIAAMTSLSRMGYAFSRDGAVPGRRLWSRVSPKTGVPVNAVLGGAVAGVAITLPALYKSPAGIPVAFYAVVSVAVIGLYLAFLIPIYYRLRHGSAFQPGPWSLGRHYRWMNVVAAAEIVVISIYFCMPIVPGGVPFTDDFSWFDVNYAPIVTGAVLLAITVWWFTSARKWFAGPRRTIDEEPLTEPATPGAV
ncbi:amino acid permease [Cryptosporangium aurantiacum]|uniref:Amino acid/polyamine/organocation transporter, APC superfamily n=1 Tax=Cryptosporangium aurantiacum TaxID=134849 RepID=A0A1M7JNE4_9ACTN|nr:amino acid permease [Cryptosporangium aurantiacum]SHM54528.1 amino acid/polyamine/organocation transporter, APC superfamily [Cryptosporangium aurantiacum]